MSVFGRRISPEDLAITLLQGLEDGSIIADDDDNDTAHQGKDGAASIAGLLAQFASVVGAEIEKATAPLNERIASLSHQLASLQEEMARSQSKSASGAAPEPVRAVPVVLKSSGEKTQGPRLFFGGGEFCGFKVPRDQPSRIAALTRRRDALRVNNLNIDRSIYFNNHSLPIVFPFLPDLLWGDLGDAERERILNDSGGLAAFSKPKYYHFDTSGSLIYVSTEGDQDELPCVAILITSHGLTPPEQVSQENASQKNDPAT